MIHFCSAKSTHTENRVCRWAKKSQSSIIHAEGVRVAFPSSTPKACNLLRFQEPVPFDSEYRARSGVRRPRVRARFAGGQELRFAAWKRPRFGVVLGHFWRAKYGHFSRAPKFSRSVYYYLITL